MRTRFTWIVAILVLVAIGFLMACSSKYSSSSNGLVVVPTQGSPEATAVMETFSLDLSNGSMSQINNVNGPPTVGLPGSVIIDPPGAYAYVCLLYTSSLPGDVSASKRYWKEDIIDPEVQVSPQGTIAISNQAGTGYGIKEDLIERLTVRKETLRV